MSSSSSSAPERRRILESMSSGAVFFEADADPQVTCRGEDVLDANCLGTWPGRGPGPRVPRCRINRAGALAGLLLAACAPGGAEVIDLGFDRAEWRFESRGRYLEVADPRGLRQIFHPWDEAEAGDYGALTTRVRLPADWRGPVCCATTVRREGTGSWSIWKGPRPTATAWAPS